jgi:hypothetical protein
MGIAGAHSGRLRRVVLNVPDAEGIGDFVQNACEPKGLQQCTLVSILVDSLRSKTR